MSHNINIENIKHEHDKAEETEKSFSANPYKVQIQSLFKQEFHGSGYKKYSIVDAKELVLDSFATIVQPGLYLQGGNNLIRKCRKASSVEELLTIMNEYLFS